MGVEFAFNAVLCCRLICHRGQTHTELFYVGAAGRMHGLKHGSCRFWQRTDLPPGSNTYGLVLCERRGTTEWVMRAPRDAYPGAQTCMDSKVVRAEFGSGLICPRAQTCCASPTRTPARLANSPGFKSFHCPRWRIKFSLERFSDSVTHLFACPAVGKFSRASSAGGRLNL